MAKSTSEDSPAKSAKKKVAKRKTAKKKSAHKNTATRTTAKKAAGSGPAVDKPVDKSKPFEENLTRTLDEEGTPAAKPAAKPKKRTGMRGGSQNVPVQNLLGSVQTRLDKMMAEIPMPKAAFLDKHAAPSDVEVEDLGSGVIRVIKFSPVGEAAADFTSLVTSVADKVAGTISGLAGKVK